MLGKIKILLMGSFKGSSLKKQHKPTSVQSSFLTPTPPPHPHLPPPALPHEKIRKPLLFRLLQDVLKEELAWNGLRIGTFSADIYFFKVKNENTRTMCKVYSKLTIKETEWRH